jgi:choline dehydrogenase-like flavoprotein
MSDVSFRTLMKATGAFGASMPSTALPSAVGAQGHVVPPTPAVGHSVAAEATQAATQTTYLFLNHEEAAFTKAAVTRLIPADPQWPGGVEAGVRPYTSTVHQSTHNCGDAVMGNYPRTSVVDHYLQCRDVPNVFRIGGSAFPQNGTYVTIGVLTYWALDAIKNRYLKSPGPLVQT